MISRILGIFRLDIFILQLANSSGASAGKSWLGATWGGAMNGATILHLVQSSYRF